MPPSTKEERGSVKVCYIIQVRIHLMVSIHLRLAHYFKGISKFCVGLVQLFGVSVLAHLMLVMILYHTPRLETVRLFL
jgi:hypothetical protein